MSGVDVAADSAIRDLLVARGSSVKQALYPATTTLRPKPPRSLGWGSSRGGRGDARRHGDRSYAETWVVLEEVASTRRASRAQRGLAVAAGASCQSPNCDDIGLRSSRVSVRSLHAARSCQSSSYLARRTAPADRASPLATGAQARGAAHLAAVTPAAIHMPAHQRHVTSVASRGGSFSCSTTSCAVMSGSCSNASGLARRTMARRMGSLSTSAVAKRVSR